MNKEPSYDDILNLPHHQSRSRPHMSIQNRAAQFAPFAALTGYEEKIRETSLLSSRLSDLATEEYPELNLEGIVPDPGFPEDL